MVCVLIFFCCVEGLGDHDSRPMPVQLRALSQRGREVIDLSINKHDELSAHVLACTSTGEVLSWGSSK